jgi:hypothetical protein
MNWSRLRKDHLKFKTPGRSSIILEGFAKYIPILLRKTKSYQHVITLSNFITMFSGTDNILHNISHIQIECEEYYVEYCQSRKTLL